MTANIPNSSAGTRSSCSPASSSPDAPPPQPPKAKDSNPLSLSGVQTLSQHQRALLLRAGFTSPSEVLLADPASLSRRLQISTGEASSIVTAIACGTAPVTAPLDSDPEDTRLKTGDEDIDRLLGGGIVPGTLCEVSGESAAGKTQFLLQLCVTVQLPVSSGGLAGHAAFLSSEGQLPTSRLHSLSSAFVGGTSSPPTDPLSHIHFLSCRDVESLLHALNYFLPALLDQHPVRLIVLDSIGALFRGEFRANAGGLAARSKDLCAVGDRLRQVAEDHGIAVVIANQVTDTFDGDGESFVGPSADQESGEVWPVYREQARAFSGQTAELSKVASLGGVWANCINTRIMLSRTGRRRRLELPSRRRSSASPESKRLRPNTPSPLPSPDKPTLLRRMHLVFSPFAPTATLDFVILPDGMRAISEDARRAREVVDDLGGGFAGDADDEAAYWAAVEGGLDVEAGDTWEVGDA